MNCDMSSVLRTGDMYAVTTPATYDYGSLWVVPESSPFVFDVRSCGGVHLALVATPGEVDRNAYEVTIGGWDNTRCGGEF